jgi:transcription-repair coupling factor (superfamily II helicase)
MPMKRAAAWRTPEALFEARWTIRPCFGGRALHRLAYVETLPWLRPVAWPVKGICVFFCARHMVDDLKNRIRATAAFEMLQQKAAQLSPGDITSAMGVAGSLVGLLVALLHEQLGRQMLVVGRDREAAEKIRDDLALLLRSHTVSYFAGGDASHTGADLAGDVADIQALRALSVDHAPVTVTHARALQRHLPTPASVTQQSFTLEAGSRGSLTHIRQRLDENGFRQQDFVESYGDYAVRGGIMDIFPFVGDNPVRVEFFGDAIESIREFDPLSQRSIKELSIAVIVPDLLTAPAESTGTPAGRAAAHASLLDYLQPEALVVVDEPELAWRELEAPAHDHTESYVDRKQTEELLAFFPRIQFHALATPAGDFIAFGATSQPAFNGSVAILRRDLAQLQHRGYAVTLTCDTQSELTRIKELLSTASPPLPEQDNGDPGATLDLGAVRFSLDALHGGFLLPTAALAVYTEHQIFNRLKRRGRKRAPRFKGFSDKELQQLRTGDYVVHQDYGIGRFGGLKKIRVRNAEQEVVSILYEEKDVLYVNLNYVNKLQKYSSKEGHVPKLTRLGSAEWDRLKSRVKKRVKDIARDLILLYARRKHLPGFAFARDTPWQKELEASFMYEDTFDQARTTQEVKQDMEAPHPMDRLVCGDVGFGKTEVAVRAAFKAVMDGKQVAVLVPTTILAMQHFHTFVDRTARYGVNVQVISRFKARKEQTGILERLRERELDIIIGTHRLLSKDVIFKNLGLLIIDEEHRFGVSAKEKLRQLRAEVDTLSLTATPIPRTLHFSLMGARDLSLIATPPRNRLPIITEITRWNDDLIREAVLREVQHGGQVYFVHDRVQNIEEIAQRLREILPGIRIQHAHGQMHAHELENVMMAFLEKQFDLLVATKIIESGLDIPNVNTIIINRADRFGMAELYQLRGRVGRSNVQAYAYLLTPPVSVMPRPTLLRLQAVEEFTELGSGFNLAMRDLEIRGAGNLLGSEQSGFIETMGFETYTRILEEAVQELKEQEFQDLFANERRPQRLDSDVVVEAEFDAFIPGSYVGNDTERLAIYRRLYALQTDEQLREVAEELKDRFGKHPEEVMNLFAVVRIRLLAAKLGFRKVTISLREMEADFPPESEVRFYEGEAFQSLMTVISRMKGKGAGLRQAGTALKFYAKIDPNSRFPLESALRILANLLENRAALVTPAEPPKQPN